MYILFIYLPEIGILHRYVNHVHIYIYINPRWTFIFCGPKTSIYSPLNGKRPLSIAFTYSYRKFNFQCRHDKQYYTVFVRSEYKYINTRMCKKERPRLFTNSRPRLIPMQLYIGFVITKLNVNCVITLTHNNLLPNTEYTRLRRNTFLSSSGVLAINLHITRNCIPFSYIHMYEGNISKSGSKSL